MVEQLIKFIELEPIKSSQVNANFQFLSDKIDKATQYYATEFANLLSRINNVQNSIRIIGAPQITFSDELPDKCIWLEGQEVSREEYSTLFAIYGTNYGEGNGVTTFNLPNCIDRVFWGSKSNDKGYIEAALPNIKGSFGAMNEFSYADGCCSIEAGGTRSEGSYGGGRTVKIDASRSSTIFKDGIKTVYPPSIKVRVYTRYQ